MGVKRYSFHGCGRHSKRSGRQLRREAERLARKEAKKQQSAQKGFLN